MRFASSFQSCSSRIAASKFFSAQSTATHLGEDRNAPVFHQRRRFCPSPDDHPHDRLELPPVWHVPSHELSHRFRGVQDNIATCSRSNPGLNPTCLNALP